MQVDSIINFIKNPMQVNHRHSEFKLKNISSSKPQKYPKQADQLQLGLVNDLKQFLFNADIGQYFQLILTTKFYIRMIKPSEIGKILQIVDPAKQFERATILATQEFNFVKKISTKIDEYLENTNKQGSYSPYYNIKVNHFLRYQSIRCDESYGCFLFHEPIIITLDELIKKKRLSYSQKIEIMGDILKVMEFLQELRICHQNITSFAFVFVQKKHQSKIEEFKENWKYDRKLHEIKITGFYQAIIVDTSYSSTHHNIIFDNAYIDPNITSFKKPQHSSDLWSIIILFYEIITGKLPTLENKLKLDQQMSGMLGWQKDFFNFFFRGTKEVCIGLKDLQIRVKNMGITSAITSEIISNKKLEQQSGSSHSRMWSSWNSSSIQTATSRRRIYSQLIQKVHHA